MINPFALVGTLVTRYADILRAAKLYKELQPKITEFIDLSTDLGRDFGLLDKATPGKGLPPALSKYNTKWIQTKLNLLMHEHLVVDGELGTENSETRQVVRAYQKKKKAEGYPTIVVDGSPGIITIYMMEQDLAAL